MTPVRGPVRPLRDVIDPVFSSGVHLSTYSALLAARSINTVLAGTLDEQQCFQEFEARYRREFGLFRDFLTEFYDLHVDQDSYFWQARKVAGHSGTDQEAFLDLVGGVSAGDFSRRPLAAAAASPLARAVAGSGAAGDGSHVLGADIDSDVLAEGTYLQMHHLLGEAAGIQPPMFEGGLVPTPDSRRWSLPSNSAADPADLT